MPRQRWQTSLKVKHGLMLFLVAGVGFCGSGLAGAVLSQAAGVKVTIVFSILLGVVVIAELLVLFGTRTPEEQILSRMYEDALTMWEAKAAQTTARLEQQQAARHVKLMKLDVIKAAIRQAEQAVEGGDLQKAEDLHEFSEKLQK